MIYIAEAVTSYHVDKICDQISDLIVDTCLEQDSRSRVSIDAIFGHGNIFLVGEITSRAKFDIKKIVREYLRKLGLKNVEITSVITQQSKDIAKKIIKGGAGDQGIMIGYACRDNENLMPQEIYIAKKILEPFKTDGKSQVILKDNKLTDIVLSIQNKEPKQLYNYLYDNHYLLDEPRCYLNNGGVFKIGGMDADSGCTGRKIVIDQYGPRIPAGGGAFSGKDATKVDRSGAYMARFIAIKLLKTTGAKEVLVKLGYVIGKTRAVIKIAYIDGKEELFADDCRPEAIIERFGLKKPIYLDLAKNGHFGRKNLPWEKV